VFRSISGSVKVIFASRLKAVLTLFRFNCILWVFIFANIISDIYGYLSNMYILTKFLKLPYLNSKMKNIYLLYSLCLKTANCIIGWELLRSQA
jgi:hypothetical protein